MFNINIDISELLGLVKIDEAVHTAAKTAGQALAAATHAYVEKEAQVRLRSRRQMFLEAVSMYHDESEDVWIVSLDAKAKWIDDGLEPHNMLDDLLKSPKAKTAKDGSKFLSVPFKHNKTPSSQTKAQKDLSSTIKAEFKKLGIPYGKIEKDAQGNAKLGLLHTVDITKQPLKAFEGPGQGKGPIGSVRQGHTGIPFLKGVQVYQRKVLDKQGKEKIQRDIMTFRMASSKQQDKGMWDHPGVEGAFIFDDAARWAQETWTKQVLPQFWDTLIVKVS